jgi:hypothetical protein
LGGVIHERRKKHGFLLSAWVFLPDYWHAIFYPAYPLTISRVMESIKVGATKPINHSRGRIAVPAALHDRALRTVKAGLACVRRIGLGRASMITPVTSPMRP